MNNVRRSKRDNAGKRPNRFISTSPGSTPAASSDPPIHPIKTKRKKPVNASIDASDPAAVANPTKNSLDDASIVGEPNVKSKKNQRARNKEAAAKKDVSAAAIAAGSTPHRPDTPAEIEDTKTAKNVSSLKSDDVNASPVSIKQKSTTVSAMKATDDKATKDKRIP